ncbi:MAG: DUF1707 SHOCT-like domain-containing protein [Longimicrobiales bacterium]
MKPERTDPRSTTPRSRRDEVIHALSTAFAQDDLSVEEFERRVDIAHRVQDVNELNALLADLRVAPPPVPAGQTASVPAPRPAPLPTEVRERDTMVAIMGGVERAGPWVPARSNQLFALMGGMELDFREARMPAGVTEVSIFCGMGGVEIIVPPGLVVDATGAAIMGGFAHLAPPPPADPHAPVLRVRGLVIMGGVDIQVRQPGETAKDARRRARKEKKRLRRENQ